MDLDELQKLEEYLEKIEQEEASKGSGVPSLDDLLGEAEESAQPPETQAAEEAQKAVAEEKPGEETPTEAAPSLEELLGEPVEIPDIKEVKESLEKKKKEKEKPKEEIPLEEALKVLEGKEEKPEAIETEEAKTEPVEEKQEEQKEEIKGLPYTKEDLLKLKVSIESLPYPIRVAFVTAILNDMFSEKQLHQLVELALEDSPPEVFIKFLVENIPPGKLRKILPIEPVPLSVRIAEELGLDKYRAQIEKFFQKLPAYLTGIGITATVATALYVFVAMPMLSMRYAYMGIEALKEARFSISQKYYEKAIKLAPDPISVVLMYIFEYLRLKMYDRALTLINLYREDPRVQSAEAYYYLETADYEKALNSAQNLIKQGTEDPLPYITAYRAAKLLGNTKIAESYLKEAQKKFPNNALVLTETIKTLLERGDVEGAGKIFEKLKRVASPEVLSYDVLIELGEKALKTRNLDLASDISSYLRSKAGSDPNVQIFLSEYDIEIGVYREAYSHLRKLEKLLPSYWKIYSLRGKAALGIAKTTVNKDETLKFIEMASTDFEKALQLNPSDASSWVGLGDIQYYFFKAFEKADSYYFSAYSLGHYHPKFYFNYGVTRYKMGNIETALSLWENRRKDVETPAIVFNIATAYLLKNQSTKALNLYQYLLTMKKGEKRNYMLSKTYNNIGVLLSLKGEATKAMANFVKASEYAYRAGKRNPYSQANMNLISSLQFTRISPDALLNELQINREPEWFESKEDLPLFMRE